VKDPIYIRDELVLEAHPDGRYILLSREGEPGAVHIFLNEVRHLAAAMCKMAAEMAGSLAGDDDHRGTAKLGPCQLR
jgi:hypothetical protein